MLKIIQANGKNERAFLDVLQQRSDAISKETIHSVQEIISHVREEGDRAVRAYTNKFDGINLSSFEVTEQEISDGMSKTTPELLRILKRAERNISAYHMHQKQNSYIVAQQQGILMGQRVRPLQRVGVYVPGGTASYPSSVLMNTVPAKVAGVEEIIMVTPPGKDGKVPPVILAAAAIAGVTRIYKMGGAQAIAALAYGTESIQRVDKIVGPGNIFVAAAKQLVFGVVDIDMVAGPSEVLIIADDNATPKYLAADLMSQAEHDVLASATLLCTSRAMAEAVNVELKRQIKDLSRRKIIEESITNVGAAIICRDIDEAINLANLIAPEHLELAVENPMNYLPAIDNAGSVFLGEYTPEPFGDYMAGPNHVLPTSGTARFFSPLSVDTFMKKSSYLSFDRAAFEAYSDDVIAFAYAEGLTAHANSVIVRKEDI